ncbi:MAG: GTP cyclohydrolase [Sphingobacteriia bacterium]|nr:GTP cyclohydrolase [Sphingobacteriia bacterium]
MFVVLLKYIKPIEEIDKFLIEHRTWLKDGYEKNYFLASGPKLPRNGGVIISLVKDKEELKKILAEDPFYKEKLAEYEIIEFEPVLYNQVLKNLI